MRNASRLAVLVAVVLAAVLLPTTNAAAATYNGTVTGSSGWYHDWSFPGPWPSMTASLSSAQHNTYSSVGQNMKQPDPLDPPGPNFWGGTGDYTSVYSPTDIKDTTGVTVEYQTDTGVGGACEGVTGPGTPGAQVSCGNVDTLTFNFSRPVTDATLHVMNLGATTSLQSAWVELTNTSGQTLTELSSGASNFQVDGSTIKPDFPVTGTNLGSHATGAGSVKVAGTYSSVTFAVDLEWYSITLTSPETVTEGLAFNWTLGDALPAPAVSAVAPPSGPSSGGTPITISGANFVAGATVSVGGVACAPVTFVSASELKCATGAHAAAVTDVVVTNPDLQTATKAGVFTYTAACPLTVKGARAANKKLPVRRTVTLVTSMSTVPQCRLQILKSATYRSILGRGDMAAPVKIWVTKGGQVQAYARVRGAKATVRAVAKHVALPYVADSSTWSRTWKS